MSELNFVNLNGDPVDVTPPPPVKKPPREPIETHRGWRVTGLPPGSADWAKRESGDPAAWDYDNWLMNAKAVRVGRDYHIAEAAHECARMAEKAGWLRVRVVELKKEY